MFGLSPNIVFVVAPINGFTYSDKRFPPRACIAQSRHGRYGQYSACFKFNFISMIFCMLFK